LVYSLISILKTAFFAALLGVFEALGGLIALALGVYGSAAVLRVSL
jgi:hypothetical protein